MKKPVGSVRFRVVLPCLVLAVILTLPPAVTWSKYVWKDDIELTLKLNYPEQGITSILPEFPDASCTLDGTGIRIASTGIPGQWILSAEDGYALPERIVVKVGESEYPVDTSGQNSSEAVSFDPATGTLLVSDSLLTAGEGAVTVIADGVSAPETVTPPEEEEPEPEVTPSEDGEPFDGTVPETGSESAAGSESGEEEPASNPVDTPTQGNPPDAVEAETDMER